MVYQKYIKYNIIRNHHIRLLVFRFLKINIEIITTIVPNNKIVLPKRLALSATINPQVP